MAVVPAKKEKEKEKEKTASSDRLIHRSRRGRIDFCHWSSLGAN
jgi:hypothetical protein